MLTVATAATEYVRVPITVQVPDGSPYDPTQAQVQFAFAAPGAAPATWYTGSWERYQGQPYARCLVGPTGGVVALPAATYIVWVRIAAAPEDIILRSGGLQVQDA